MNIDSINVVMSWANIRDLLKDLLSDLPIKDIDIKYDNCIIVSGKYMLKIEIPFSVRINRIACSNGSIIIDFGDIEVYVKIPIFFRDILINSLIKKLNDNIILEGNALIIRQELISELLPFDEYIISSITANEKQIEANLKDIKISLNTGDHKD